MTAPSQVRAFAAVDLGATSGRVMIGRVGTDVLELEQVARFPNGPVRRADGLHWDFEALVEHVVAGLAEAVRREPAIESIGIDTWAVDYGLLRDDALLAEPFHYRDERGARGADLVHARVPFAELYDRNGLQFLPFTSLYQLATDDNAAKADTMLLIPDLLAHRLTGARVAERTNASTTGLLGVHDREWDLALAERIGSRPTLLPPLVDPGARIGRLLPAVAARIGADLPVVAVGSHDTASAVVAAPLTSPSTAYISCGTWGLVGLELAEPVLTEAARTAGFTHELGVDGRIRFLHNVTGLWLLSETVRAWEGEDGTPIDLSELLDAAAAVPPDVPLFDADDPSLSSPGDMPARIAAALRATGTEPPSARAAFVRMIVESIAQAFADAVSTASALTGIAVETIDLIGGGSLNRLLCQATADRTGLPVLAGPVEATALGNLLVQARAAGVFGDHATLEELRRLVRRTHPPTRWAPRG
ncbi:rhamnulokinase [Microbacterium azadirachtae]|uniref:Rhamnulokinase n=1 Tax=Microbacterium azadirachtae TaxID=582680 RepID=A0A1I6G5M4_9MICO|nr:rhamnulokinase family protein [Microbacterium azadirachtae]SDL34770.1 rhamnulokinase [Microbacterium azadirachtae]SEF65347.1 rhamnulokinase [Microbacterium azadirachtae]SEF66185.1 rhamnulokinase [Microbacterium azadirachtae]SFR37421.1 rhamnulokinase [Microbacterium azadirachtae]